MLRRASAYGKHLFHHYVGGPIVHVHLGLYGSFSESDVPMPLPVGEVRMRMVGADFGTDLRGPTACEVLDEAQVDAVIARLGPDPLHRDADPARAWKRITKSQRPIGGLLMDQAVIAGVGNVYRNELLFRHGIDPYRPGRTIDAIEFDSAWADLVELMRVGYSRGKIHVIRKEHDHGAAVVCARAPAHLRVPPGRRPLPGVRHQGAHRCARGPQRVLVPDLSNGAD